AKFKNKPSCDDEKKYKAPNPCQPLPECELDITDVWVGTCYYNASTQKSEVKIKVSFKWKNGHVGDYIHVSTANQAKSLYVSSANGQSFLEFIVPADDQQRFVWAKFWNKPQCMDEDKYRTPPPCVPLPDCKLEITELWLDNCYYDSYTQKSLAKLRVYFKWSGAMLPDQVMVSTAGQTKSLTVGSANGTGFLDFIVPADGSHNNLVWAKFKNKPSCDDEKKYKAPAPCPLPCKLEIKDIEVGDCYVDPNDMKSKVKVTIHLKWSNGIVGDYIRVITNNQEQLIYVSNANSERSIHFIMPANNAQREVWAKFSSNPNCADDRKYRVPPPCQMLPDCQVEIRKVTVGECRYSEQSGKSIATVQVCVAWTNAPSGEKLLVSLANQMAAINVTQSDGSHCVNFTINADGSKNNVVRTRFETTQTCQDSDKYDAPAACDPPGCDCDIPGNLNKIVVKFSSDCKSVCICSGKDISNIVFDLGNNCFQNFDVDIKKEDNEITGNKKKQTFRFNQPLNGVWVKAGNNLCTGNPSERGCSGGPGQACCPGCGEYFECKPENYYTTARVAANETTTDYTSLLQDRAAAATPEATPSELRLFPNPATNHLYVDLGAFAGKSAHLQVFNTVGQLMYQTRVDELTEDLTRLELGELSSDMYFLRVYIPEGGSFTQKFIVRK
ncbi:MAG TPA: T9SS type A sorting domain-containing protein, partial [Saprospiraceae bacterium]|nr:T9SS type A sorting domain-containing protein [Saprospiraceae bacterium]